jgi:hypothetical protein
MFYRHHIICLSLDLNLQYRSDFFFLIRYVSKISACARALNHGGRLRMVHFQKGYAHMRH